MPHVADEVQTARGHQGVDHHAVHAHGLAQHGPQQLRHVSFAAYARQALGQPGQQRARPVVAQGVGGRGSGAERPRGRILLRPHHGGRRCDGPDDPGHRAGADPAQSDPALLHEAPAPPGRALQQSLVGRLGGESRLGHQDALGPLHDGRGRGGALQVRDLRSQPGHNLGEREHLG